MKVVQLETPPTISSIYSTHRLPPDPIIIVKLRMRISVDVFDKWTRYTYPWTECDMQIAQAVSFVYDGSQQGQIMNGEASDLWKA